MTENKNPIKCTVKAEVILTCIDFPAMTEKEKEEVLSSVEQWLNENEVAEIRAFSALSYTPTVGVRIHFKKIK